MSSSTREKIISYLGQGIQQSVVASSCGVTPAYISQLLEVQEVRDEIALLQAGQLEKALTSDAKMDDVEKLALRIVEQKLPYVKSAGEAAGIFAKLNGAKRKAATGKDANDALAAQQVIIQIPKSASLHFKLNSTNQIIEVEGRTMAPLPSSALPALQRARMGSTELEVTDVEVPSVPKSAALSPSKSSANEVAEAYKQKSETSDIARAKEIISRLPDIVGIHNGVRVVL